MNQNARERRAAVRAVVRKGRLHALLASSRPFFRVTTVPLFAACLFAITGMLAASTVAFALRQFAEEGGVDRRIFVIVPGLFAMLFALIVYQNAERRIKTVAQSLSRSILVALLCWMSFSALSTWVWCLPINYLACYSNALIVTGLIGGGPMLAAALSAGAIVGWLIKSRRLGWIME